MKNENGSSFSPEFYVAFNHTVAWIGKCVIAGLIYLSVSKIAGRDTEADINIIVSLLGWSSTVPVSLALVFGLGGIVYGSIQKRLREKEVKIRLEKKDAQT